MSDPKKRDGWYKRISFNKKGPNLAVDMQQQGRVISLPPNVSRTPLENLGGITETDQTSDTRPQSAQGLSDEGTNLQMTLLSIYSAESIHELVFRINFELTRICNADDVSVHFVDYIAEQLFNVDESSRKLSDTISFVDASVFMDPIRSRAVRFLNANEPGAMLNIPKIMTSGIEMHRAFVPIIDRKSSQTYMIILLSRSANRPPFNDKDRMILKPIANHVAVSYSKVLKIVKLEQKVKEHQVLHNLTKSLYSGGKDAKNIVPKILRHATTYIGADRCSLFMLDTSCDELYSEEFDISTRYSPSPAVSRAKTSITIHRELSMARSPLSGRSVGKTSGACHITKSSGSLNSLNSQTISFNGESHEQDSGLSPPNLKKRMTSAHDTLQTPKDASGIRFSTKVGVAGFVVQTGETVNITDAYSDERFNQSIDKELNYKTKTILCTPVRNHTGDLIGVVQLVNKQNGVFTEEDAEWFENYVLICNMALHNAFIAELEERRQFEQKAILQTAETISQPFDIKVLLKSILCNARTFVGSALCTVFFIDDQNNELVRQSCDCIDVATAEQNGHYEFKGIAGHVAQTGKNINVKDAPVDPRFDFDIDQIPGHTTSSLLCVPIKHGNKIVGALQLINKQSRDSFTPEDESHMQVLSNVIGISFHNSKQYELVKRAEAQSKIAFEIIHYHTHFKEEELEELHQELPQDLLEKGNSFGFNCRALSSSEMCSFAIHMYKTLGLVEKFNISQETLSKFILTIRNNYRDVPYHNWSHAFSVSHAFFAISQSTDLFEYLEDHEVFAHLTACLVHDIDHRGKNNAFLKTSGSELNGVYGDKSILEHHHFSHFSDIIKNPVLDIFENVPTGLKSDILKHIEYIILTTDLAGHFGILKDFTKMFIDKGVKYDKRNRKHRRLLTAILMTASDISAITKPWEIHVNVTNQIYEEFFQQGNAEKEAGILPIEMMDSNRADIPRSQLGFIDHVCYPAYNALYTLLPNTKPMVDGVKANREKWQKIVDKQDVIEEQSEELYLPSL